MSPLTYKKLVATHFGKEFQNIIQIIEVPYREPAANEVVIRNHYAGVNFADIPILMGRSHLNHEPPFDLGLEAIGEVVAAGRDVKTLRVGDAAVSAMFGNGYREYATLDAKLAIKVPDITPELLSLLSSGVRASIALKVAARMTEGQTVLVTAAASSSGHYAVQLARLAGNHVIGSCGSDEEADLLHEMGCHRVVQRKREALEDVLKREYPNGVHLIYESFGGRLFDICLDNLAVRGRMIIAGVIAEYTRHESAVHAVDVYDKLLWKSATLHGFWLPDFGQFILNHAQQMLELHHTGRIRSVVDPTPFRGLRAVVDALEYLNGWHSAGTVVVQI